MTYFIRFSLLLFITVQVFAKTPTLILFFDVNRTLVAFDKVKGQGVDYILNRLLTEKYEAIWGPEVTKPVSYKDYVFHYLLPGPKHDQALKAKRQKYIGDFLEMLKQANHPLSDQIHAEFQQLRDGIKNQKGNIFPSFYRLLDHLNKKGVSYKVVLRTFGTDNPELIEEIEKLTSVRFEWPVGRFDKATLRLGSATYKTSEEIYQCFKEKGHLAIRDDWPYWNTHQETAAYGKPLYLDEKDTEILPIFFDDNALEKEILAVKGKGGKDIALKDVLGKHVFAVDTLDALLDQDYYVKCVERALK